jgi:hypothetical protein
MFLHELGAREFMEKVFKLLAEPCRDFMAGGHRGRLVVAGRLP